MLNSQFPILIGWELRIEHSELSIGQVVCFLIRDRICEKLYEAVRYGVFPPSRDCFCQRDYRLPRCWPPSTERQAPVTQLARSDARKITAFATSSTVPSR